MIPEDLEEKIKLAKSQVNSLTVVQAGTEAVNERVLL